MKRTLQCVMAAAALVAAGHAAAQITFYEGEGYRGRAITTDKEIWNFDRTGMNDKTSSIVVDHGRWEVCEHARFEGRCVVLRRGSYPSLRDIGMNNTISSVRPLLRDRPGYEEPQPFAEVPDYEWRRRSNERVYEVPVTSVRAVVGAPNQRCWVERQQVPVAAPRGEPNVGGAVVGALIGGVLGHQVGRGGGRDAATAAGVIGGAAIGANTGNTGGTAYVDRDVQRCQTVSNAVPEYWDVTYNYRGMEHRIQMSAAPGPTIIVNERGEPRQ
ncbi:MAG: glycine zipper 2TM domain-containing protein [Ramlibacter sp.]|nr:glycine zipper 2TM domain-containing protein [Ramlibacter sp.]